MNVRVLENKLQTASLQSTPVLQAALSDMPQNEAAPALLEIAENTEQKRRGAMMKGGILSIIFFVLFFVSHIIPLLFLQPPYASPWQIAGGVLPYAFFILLGVGYRSARKVLQTQQNAVAALLLCPNRPRFLPSLVDGLNTPKTPEWKTMLYPALTAALWEATEDDLALRLDAPRRAALRAFVAFDFPAVPLAPLIRSKTQVSTHFDDATTDLTVAVIRTLVSVGDKKTVKILQRIIKTERNTRNEAVVRDAAREFLPVLTAKIAENEEVFRRLQTLANTETENPYAAIEKYVDTLSQETAPVVLAEYLMEQKQNAARSRIFAGLGLAAAVGVTALVYFVLAQQIDAGLIGILSTATSVSALFCTAILRRPDGETQAGKITYELAQRSGDDTRLLPVLLHALRPIVDKKQSDAVQKALIQLLPLLRAGDAALVPPALRRPIRAWLTMPRGARGQGVKERTVVALNALAVLGDTKALRRVEAVARYAGRAKHGDTLRQTAARCAEALKTRCQR